MNNKIDGNKIVNDELKRIRSILRFNGNDSDEIEFAINVMRESITCISDTLHSVKYCRAIKLASKFASIGMLHSLLLLDELQLDIFRHHAKKMQEYICIDNQLLEGITAGMNQETVNAITKAQGGEENND